MEYYEGNVHQEQLEKTDEDAKVYHETYFYFDYKGESFRAKWFTVGYSYAGIRIWKREKRDFIIKWSTWSTIIYDALKHGTNEIIQNKKTFYNAIKTFDLCVKSLNETIIAIPHTEKIIR